MLVTISTKHYSYIHMKINLTCTNYIYL